MFNECLIHLCDCTCLNVLHLLNHMLIKHKNILKCFNCFWKVFLFWKFSKTVQLCFGDSASQVKQVASLLKSSHNSLASQAPSHKKDLENFQKYGFLAFSRFSLAIGSRVEALVAKSRSLLRMLRDSLLDLLVSGPSSCEKYLDKFFKICDLGFWWLARDSFQSRKTSFCHK